ncbi:MAG TPA: PEGA domain-containing protein [Kiritimatiellia bacterium]
MKRIPALLAALAWFASFDALAVSQYEYESDHTLLVNIVSDPPGAQVYSVPATTNGESVLLGRTPYTALVEFNWKRGWISKRWSMLSVRSPADICRVEYTSGDKLYDLYMIYKIEAPGRETLHRDDLVASFIKPKDFEWDDLSFLPSRKTVEVTLPVAAVADAQESQPASAGPATVMMATSSDEGTAMGTVHVVANVDEASVLVDGKPAGRAPVKLVLGAGDHVVEVHKPGYLSYSNSLAVKAHSQVALKVTLARGEAQ